MSKAGDEYDPKQAFAEIDAAFIDKRIGSISYNEHQPSVTVHCRDGSEITFGLTQTGDGILLMNAEKVERHTWSQINISPEGMS